MSLRNKEKKMHVKQIVIGLGPVALGLIALMPAQAQNVTIASDSGDNYTQYGQYAGLNNGTGFQPWIVVGGDGGGASFVNSQSNIQGPNTTNVFDLYDNGTSLPSTATRPFSAPLGIGSTFATSYLNEYVPPTGNVGLSLDDASGTALFTFYLPGSGSTGDPGDWRFVSGGIPASLLTTGVDAGLPYQYYGAVQIAVTATGAGTYTFSASEGPNYQNNGGAFTTTGTLPGGGPIAEVVYFTANTGGKNDVEFNNLSITTPAPEPTQTPILGLGFLGLAGLMLRASRRTGRRSEA